jgi:hypothetical protein
MARKAEVYPTGIRAIFASSDSAGTVPVASGPADAGTDILLAPLRGHRRTAVFQ